MNNERTTSRRTLDFPSDLLECIEKRAADLGQDYEKLIFAALSKAFEQKT